MNPIHPDDLFHRLRTIRGLRDLADFLETHPHLPISRTGADMHVFPPSEASDNAARAQLADYANALGIPLIDDSAQGGHITAIKTFGPIAYRLCHVPARYRAERDARDSYAHNIQLNAADNPDADDQTAAA